MDLLQNPFNILTATQQDSRHRIMELAEERVLLSDADECMAARAELINPRKRISAEVAWLPGVAPERAYDMLMLLESSTGNHLGSDKSTSITPVDSLAAALSRLPYAKKYNVAGKVLELLKLSDGHFTEVREFLGIDTLTPIARANLLAARMSRLPDNTPDVVAEWILALAEAFEAINPAEVGATLNEERRVSGFPEITDLPTIAAEIQHRRHYYQQVIKSVLENISVAKKRVMAVNSILCEVEVIGKPPWPILIEDTLDSYEVGARDFLEIVEKNIETQNKKLRIAAEAEKPDTIFTPIVDEFIQTVEDWGVIAYPIQLNKKRQGLYDSTSHRVERRVQQLAIHLFNEYDKLHASQRILNMLQAVFDGLPEIIERITADLETLNKIAEQREQ